MAKAEGLNTLLPGAPIQSGPLNQNFQVLRDSVNTIDASQLAPSSVENSKLAGSISVDKLAGGITGSKLADGTITSDKLSSTSPNQAVAEDNIRDGAVTYDKIKFGEVYGATSDGVTRHIAPGTIGTVDLRNEAVTSAKIGQGEVKTGNLASKCVVESKLHDDLLAKINKAVPLSDDTGWLTNQLTAASGWSINFQQIRRVGRTVSVYLSVTRTGAAIPVEAQGNVTNQVVATISASFAPLRYNQVLVSGGAGRVATGFISDVGIRLAAVSSGADITQGESLSLGGSYFIN